MDGNEDESDRSEAVRWLRSQSPDEQERIRSQLTVIHPVLEFIRLVFRESNLRAAWPLIDPVLRTCLVQQWLIDNAADVDKFAQSEESLLGPLIADKPDHWLWQHFERVHLRGLADLGDLYEWGIGSSTRLHSPGVETVMLLPPGVEEWLPGDVHHTIPILVRHDTEAGWRILHVGSDAIPVPGWPPSM